MSIAKLQDALERRSVVRATVMRATLHLVAAADYFVLDTVSAEWRLAAWASAARRAGADLEKLNAALLDFCAEPRTVAEMEEHLVSVLPDGKLAGVLPAGIGRAAYRLASGGGGLVHVPPSGNWKWHGKPRYIDARVWLKKGERPDPDAALTIALERYLRAYGPATTADFAKWVGQPRIGRIRVAVAGLEARLVRHTGPEGQELLDLADLDVPDGDAEAPVRFLARWDSALIAYDERERLLPRAHRSAVIKKNGDFLPTFLVGGFVAGLWSTEVKEGTASIRLEPFGRVSRPERSALEEEAERLLRFVEPDAGRHEVVWA
jgi:hypothetical protein